MELSSSETASWLVESLRCGVIAIDRDGGVTAWNDDVREILAAPADPTQTVLGRDCRDLLSEHPKVASLLLGALDGRDRPARAEIALELAGEARRTVGYTLGAVRDESGEVQGALLLFRDLTPFERSDERERLRGRLAALGEMAAGMAHEIRNPLAGMEVLAGLLRRRLGDRPAERELVDELLGELRAVERVVKQGIDFVRPVETTRELADPVRLLEEALSRASSRLPFEGSIERCYAPDVPKIQVDPDRLRTVLTDLIVNAIEAAGEVPVGRAQRLRLSASMQPVHVPMPLVRPSSASDDNRLALEPAQCELVLGVADSGSGVPEELRERIFYPFFTTKQSGLGVGLATAQKIVAGHGGVLEHQPGPCGGSVFLVRLPVAGAGAEG